MGGDTYERELVNTYNQIGMTAMRAPTSGSATDRDLPDVIALKPVTVEDISTTIAKLLPQFANKEVPKTVANNIGRLSKTYGVELKSGDSTTLYVEKEEVESLRRFCDTAGAKPRIAARYTKKAHPVKHFLLKPENARMTDEGNYGLPVEDIEHRASEIITPETSTKDPNLTYSHSQL